MEQSQQPIKSSPRDVFIYLLSTGALYFSAFAVITLLVGYVDILLPDPLKGDYFDPRGEIRWPLALLVVIFPVYLWAMRFVRRDIAADAAKAELRVRRWLLNLTLFLSAILLIGDLVALIFNFLEGDLTMPFMLKVLAVLAVGSAVFWYYLMDLRTKGGPFAPRTRRIVLGLIGLVALAALSGFVLAGSPFRQRQMRFDAQKVNDLQNIQGYIVNYWQKKQALPPSIDALRDDISGFVPPKDPESGAAYEYRSAGPLSFELCAEFNLPSSKDRATEARPVAPYYEGKPGAVESWEHGEGRVCFSRVIDPELYPPLDRSGAPIKPAFMPR